ncbi:MAG: hypothetical protein ACRDK4_10615 [Solirubrobacteraceae bacterium]
MKFLPLPELTVLALRDRSVTPAVERGVQLIISCLEVACAGVADDCDADLRHDDSTSEGQLRWRRCRNHVKKLLDEHGISGLEDAVADVTDNALVVRVGGCAVSFYSARNGINHPDLAGSSKTKRAVVSEMQTQINGLEAPEEPTRLVVLYEADGDGLGAAVVGMLGNPREWAWRFSVYDRDGFGRVETGEPTVLAAPSYDSEPEPELPPIKVVEADEDASRNFDS